MTAVISASNPARSRARMVSCTENVAVLAPPHSTAMRLSVWYMRFCTLGHARVCTATPRPRVIYPTISSPGIGLQHLARFTKHARNDLPRRIFSEADRGVQILDLRQPVVRRELEHVCFRNFLQAAAKVPRFIFEQPLAHFPGFFPFLLVDPVANLTFRRRRLHEAEPVAAGVVALLRENLHHVAA